MDWGQLYGRVSWEDLTKKEFAETPFLINPYVARAGITFLWGETSTGKCLGTQDLVRLADGSCKKAIDVQVGDCLLGLDGLPNMVIHTHSGEDDMFQIIPKRGKSWGCNSKHILSLERAWKMKTAHTPMVAGERETWKDYVSLEETYEDINISDFLTFGETKKRQFKLYRRGVERFGESEQPLPLDPYLLGLFLGDGHFGSTGVELVGMEESILKAALPLMRGAIPGKSHGMWRLRKRFPELEALGLTGRRSGNKFIPKEYLVASEADRLALLAGLIDTDGSNTGGTGYDYISKSPQLAKDIASLARSLGMWCSDPVAKESYCQTGGGGTYWRLYIPATRPLPLKITRKLAEAPSRDTQRTSFRVEPSGRGTYAGFTLERDPHFFMEDYTVNHNSPLGWHMAKAIGEGGSFFGLPTEKGRVLYIEVDTPQRLVAMRLARIEPAKGVDFLFLPPLSIPHVAPMELHELNEAAKTNYDCVIVNTLRKVHSLDDRQAETTKIVYGFFQHLFPGASLVFVHHTKKTQMDQHGASVGRDKESFSGAMNWLNDAQVGIHIVPYQNRMDGVNKRLLHHKTQVSAEYRGLGLLLEGDGATLRCPLQERLDVAKVLLEASPLRGVKLDSEIASRLGVSVSTGQRLRKLVEAGAYPGVEWLGRKDEQGEGED
jgi:hypothetical protein